jgi:hypothetical protein
MNQIIREFELLSEIPKLDTPQLQHIGSALSGKQDFLKFCQTLDYMRKLIYYKFIEADNSDHESMEYKNAIQCFKSLNGFIGDMLSFRNEPLQTRLTA